MSEYLDKSKILFKRGQDGDLLPVEAKIDLPGVKAEDAPKIRCLPMTSGKLTEIREKTISKEIAEGEADKQIIIDYCLEPKFTKEELEDLPIAYQSAIVTAIIALSTGINEAEIKNKTKEKIVTEADNFL